MMKIRPRVQLNGKKKYPKNDLDFRLKYTCPLCGKRIKGYKQEEGCDNCNILYDWGKEKPHVIRRIKWD